MSYVKYLKETLKPLHVYDLENGPGANELEVQGQQLDLIYNTLSTVEQEAFLKTACDYGISAWEEIFPKHGATGDILQKKAALSVLMTLNDSSFTVKTIYKIAQLSNVNIHIDEDFANCLVSISFPNTAGMPHAYESIQWIVEMLIPCHLEIQYILKVMTWTALETKFPTWAHLELTVASWSALDTFA